MAKSKANNRIYGDLSTAVWYAPAGTTMPTALAAPVAPFVDVGWLANDGVDLDRDTDVVEVQAYQAGQIIRRKTLLKLETLKFVCLEENLAVLGLVYPGATFVTASMVTTMTPAGAGSIAGAFVVDFFDGVIQKRYRVTSGEAALSGTIPHKSSDPTQYEITLSMYTYDVLATSTAWV